MKDEYRNILLDVTKQVLYFIMVVKKNDMYL